MHTVVRISEKVEKELSMEERLQHVEEELGKMRQILSNLVEKGMGGSPSDPLTKGGPSGLQAAVIEAESTQQVLGEEPSI